MKSTDNSRYRITEYTTGFYIEEDMVKAARSLQKIEEILGD